ncbi:MAG: DUF6789 family protein [Thermomicrobiales bacterium]
MIPREIAAGAIAGTAAAIGYIAAMKADLALVDSNTDDLILLGYPLVRDADVARRVGALVHVANGAALGVAYSLVGRRYLPGPGWLRGAIFANLENTLLYSLAKFEQHHPAIRDQVLDRYATPTAFLQSIGRHVAYGVILGYVEDRLRA